MSAFALVTGRPRESERRSPSAWPPTATASSSSDGGKTGMSAEDVVTAALSGIERGEVVIAPGVEDYSLPKVVFGADLAAFHGRRPHLASRSLAG